MNERRPLQRVGGWLERALLRPLPDHAYLALRHRRYFGRWPDYRQPRTFPEKLHAYMLRCRDPLLQIAADKYESRAYIAQHVGADALVPMIGLWERAADVPLQTLPRPCVIKPTAASGKLLMLHPGEELDLVRVRRTMDGWTKRDYSRINREWCYRNLPRRILAETMLLDDEGRVPADIKAYVIGGEVRFISVDRDRFVGRTRNFYSPQWDLLRINDALPAHAPDPRPPVLERMMDMARTLAAPFEFLRVDFYLLGSRLFVGELTNYPAAGFLKIEPRAFDEKIAAFWPQGRNAAV